MASLEDVLRDFDRRLTLMEDQLQRLVRAADFSQNSDLGRNVPIPPPPSQPKAQQSTGTATKSQLPPSYSARESQATSVDSSSVLAFIGIIFVVLAGVFFIKITIDSGWLTPMRQILLAAGTGLVFLLTPQFFPRAEREYGALLAGAGVTILHLTWLGAFSYHKLLGANAALVCATLVGVFALLSNFGRGNQAFVLVAMAGTYLSAPIVGYNTAELSTLSLFLIIWNISFSASSFISKRRDIMFIASYFAVFTALLLSGVATGADQLASLLVLQLIQFVVFSVAMVSFSAFYKTALTKQESLAVLPLLILFYFSTGHLISEISPELKPWLGITIGVFTLVLYFLAHARLKDGLQSGPVLTAFSALTFVHGFYFQLLDESSKPIAALLIGIVTLSLWKRSTRARDEFFWPLMIFMSTFVYGAMLTIFSANSMTDHLYNWAYGVFALVAALGLNKQMEEAQQGSQLAYLLLGFAHFEVMLGFYRFSSQISWSGALFVTVTWAAYALGVLGYAYSRRDKLLGNSALIILIAVSLKALLYDVGNTSNLIRVVCLLAQGLLLYGCGWIFKKMQHWKA